MKKAVMTFVTVLCVSGAALADNGWGIYGTYWAPGNWDSAGGVGTRVSLEVVPHAQLDISCSWFQELGDDEGLSDAKMDVMPVDIGLSFHTGTKPVDIYLLGGYSFYYIDGSVFSEGERDEAGFDDQSGFYAGAGIEIPVFDDKALYGANRITFMVEALYRYVSVDEIISSSSDLLGGEAGGGCINAGFMIRW